MTTATSGLSLLIFIFWISFSVIQTREKNKIFNDHIQQKENLSKSTINHVRPHKHFKGRPAKRENS